MNTQTAPDTFPPLNRGYNSVFQPHALSVGLVVPIEAYPHSPVPQMDRHLQRVQLAEKLGFAAVWLRDVPFHVPSFGDAGQTFDPFVYLGYLAAQTQDIALGVSSIILPLRHPVHVAKAAATADQLSNGRLVLGIASGDRPEEYPALHQDYTERGRTFRESVETIRQLNQNRPKFENSWGRVGNGIDLLPKTTGSQLPQLITGGSQQSPAWVAQNGDGWMTYPRNPDLQASILRDYRECSLQAGRAPRPVMEPLYIDLDPDPDLSPNPIHLGLRLGINALRRYLEIRQEIGVHHVALNLRFNQADPEETLHHLATNLLPDFHPTPS